MKVKIAIEFEVEPADDDCCDELTENEAKSAASVAAYDYLSLVKVSGYSGDSESVEVHVDGFGKCRVSIGQDRE